MKKFFYGLIIVCCYIVIAMYIRVGFCIYNANVNSKLQLPLNSEELILDQSKLSEFRFGVLSANNNCCGAIATYNFLRLNGRNANFKTILSIYDVFGTNVYGKFGANPLTIKNYLKLNGFNAKICLNTMDFDNLAKRSKTSILLYFYKWGAHYITLNYNEETDLFKMYNYNYGAITEMKIKDVLHSNNTISFFAMLIYCDDIFE